MATDERDTEQNVRPEVFSGVAPDKKKASKFQPFKKLFGRRKKREAAAPDCEAGPLKPSHSSGNICNSTQSSDEETNNGLRSSSFSMGSRAFSHESIFIPDGREESEASVQAMSQENIVGKVKTLQHQLAKDIKLGQPSQMLEATGVTGGANVGLEAEALPGCPMETTETHQDLLLPDSYNKSAGTPDSLSPTSMHGTRQDTEEKVTPVRSSRPKRHHSPSGTIETVNLDSIPLGIACLDNSAAKHKLSVKPKNQRVSKKHRSLSKELESLTVPQLEPGILDTTQFEGEIFQRDAAGQEQKSESQKAQSHQRSLETEKKMQAEGVKVKGALEHKQLQEFEESQREQGGKKQKLQEHAMKMEESKSQDEKKRPHLDLEEDMQGLEEQGRRERGPLELEEQRRSEEKNKELETFEQWEEQIQQEVEKQKQLEEQRRQEAELQRQEEQTHQGLEKQKQQEDPRHYELDQQRKQRELEEQNWWEEQRWQELEDYVRQEEKRQRELEEKKQYQKMAQLKWKDSRQEHEKPKLQEDKHKGHELEEAGRPELEQKMHEDEIVHSETKQLIPHVEKRETGMRQDLDKSSNLEREEKLQGEAGRAMKLEEQKQLEVQQQPPEAKHQSTDEPKLQELQKDMRSCECGQNGKTEIKPLQEEEMVQAEEARERKGSQTLGEPRAPDSKIQPPLAKPKRQDENVHAEDKRMDTGEKELPLEEAAKRHKAKLPDKGQEEEGALSHKQRTAVDSQAQERILGEELRWQEVDARQTMPRGFTFQVSSGEKQIIFQKVNLSPVIPVREASVLSGPNEQQTPASSKGSHALPSSLSAPHTAILVTGAQLCGTAVNLNQIKDTACKSLLGLTEEKKKDIPPTENPPKTFPDVKPGSSKMKHCQDPVNNQTILAEWATIRSKILKTAESGIVNENVRGSFSRHSDDWTPKGETASHGNLRKTLSANAKFSITPAWQKFSEISKPNSGAESSISLEAEIRAKPQGPSTNVNHETVHADTLPGKANVLGTPAGKTKAHHEAAGSTEGCKFAKDLPSFLVPGNSHSLWKELAQSETSPSSLDSQPNVGLRKQDRALPTGEENVSPFGVKLRRTNYSLRFHYDQQADQKKKKRYSAGDSFDGVPSPLVTPESEIDTSNSICLKESKSPTIVKDSSTCLDQSCTLAVPVSLPASSKMSALTHEKPVSKSPLMQKPALAPKPTSQTPPPSPLSKMRRAHLTESTGQRVAKPETDPSCRKGETKGSPLLPQGQHDSKMEEEEEEEESREKKSFFPSITMPWREKPEKKPEPVKKERPVLQSRHSVDGSKLMEKMESAQPLWITLALQKQKGFREQQATREERRQAREAKQAEKLAKENASTNNQLDNKTSHISKTSTQPKPTTPTVEEEKKVETTLSRFERRERLKKSNTLPTSVTVEISDSIPSSSLAKEVTKRFSTPDTNPVSTEPAWLALAKRKAKAWSDCPQIIK